MGKAPILRDRLFIAVLVSLALACSSGEQENDEPADVPAEASVETTSEGSPEGTEPDAPDLDAPSDVVQIGRLDFVDTVGDDQVSCVGVDTCTLSPDWNSERSLGVRYTVDGHPVEGVAIRFTVVDDTTGFARLSSDTVLTDGTGTAAVLFWFSLPDGPGCVVDQAKVQVSVIEHAAVPPLFFVAYVSEGHCGDHLSVSFVYDGSNAFDSVTMYLYESSYRAAADLACSDIDKIELPTADLQLGSVLLSQSADFSVLPGLIDEGDEGQFYTIVARGELADGTPIAFGCNDTDGYVKFTSSKHVTITLEDL